jgi:hypothetical protein
VHEFLEELNPSDTVSLIEARDQVRPVIESPSQDFRFVREQLDALPPPAGSSNLADACAWAVSMLSRTSNLARDVIVLTDGQARGWSADDENLWLRFDDLLQQPRVRPNVWVVDVAGHEANQLPNFAVNRLELSRDLTVTDSPVRIKTKILYTGSQTPVNRKVYLEVDGQRLADKTLNLQLQPQGEASVEFEYRPKSIGSKLLSVVLDDDNLPGDNRADAAISVVEALPVLLIDGDPHPDPILRETFFAKAALSATSNDAPWVRADVEDWDALDSSLFDRYEVILLANVPRLTAQQAINIKEFVERGGGLFIALGDQVDANNYNRLLYDDGRGLLPARLESIERDLIADDDHSGRKGVRVIPDSLQLPWVRPFDAQHGVDFLETRFQQWWKIRPATDRQKLSDDRTGGLTSTAGENAATASNGGQAVHLVDVSPPLVPAQLTTNVPLMVTRSYGRGAVLLLAAPLDRDWSTLPTQRDFVPFVHEAVFFLAAQKSSRNVEVGLPLVLPVEADFPFRQYAFFGPGETQFDAEPAGDEFRSLVRLSDTRLPGRYVLRRKGKPKPGQKQGRREHFVVDFDRGESDLTPLDAAAKGKLTHDKRMAFVNTQQELKTQIFADNSRTELWPLLLFVFLGILIVELLMTRRLVKGGHAEFDDVAEEGQSPRVAPHEIEAPIQVV